MQCIDHTLEIQTMRGGVIIGVVHHLKPCALKQGAMVFPTWVADGHLGVGQQLAQEVRTDFERSRTAQRLHGDGAAAGNDGGVFAQQQLLRTQVVAGNALDGQIAAGSMCLHAGQFGTLNRLQQRDASLVVVVHTNTKVDLVGARVRVELLIQAKDGIAWGEFNVFKKSAHECRLMLRWTRAVAQDIMEDCPDSGCIQGLPLQSLA